MADKTEQGTPISTPRRGLFTDTSPDQQPQGSYRFALNAVDESTEGNVFSLVNENSNFLCADLPETYILLGNTYLEDGTNVLFFVDNTVDASGQPTETNSIIATLDKNCKYTEYVVSDCLGFTRTSPIEATFRIKNGCERIIYWVDHNNPDRHFNLDEANPFIRTDYVEGVDAEESKWNCEEFNIDKVSGPLCVTFVELNEFGGTIPVGTVQFTIQLLDENLNGAGYSTPTPVIPITDDGYGLDYDSIDGAPFDAPTTKSVTIDISNIDIQYAYIEINAIITTAGVTQSYFIEKIPITGTSFRYTFTGTKSNVSFPKEITYTKEILSSKSITQLENRLIRANIKSPSRDYSAYQRLANEIQVKYIVEGANVGKFTQPSGWANVAKSGEYYWDFRSFMRDEVYALGIIFTHEDGTKSPVFHIPGREIDLRANSGALPNNSDPNNVGRDSTGRALVHPRSTPDPIKGGWDSNQLEVGVDVLEKEVRHLGYLAGEFVDRWKVYNTALRDDPSISGTVFSGELAYYQCESGVYPSILDCNGYEVYGDLAGTPIRHHKMPDASLEPHYSGTRIFPLGLHFSNIPAPTGTVGYEIVRCHRNSENKTILDKGFAYYTKTAEIDEGPITFQSPYLNEHDPISVGGGGSYAIPDGPESGYTLPAALTTLVGINQSKIHFHSPLTKFKSPQLNATHFKTELGMTASLTNPQYGNTGSRHTFVFDKVLKLKQNSTTNSTIRNKAYIAANSIESSALSTKFINNYQSETFAADLADATVVHDENGDDYYTEASDPSGLLHVGYYAIKSSQRNIYSNLETLVYYPMSNCVEDSTTLNLFGGDIFITRFDYKHTYRAFVPDSQKALASDRGNSKAYNSSTPDTVYNYASNVTFWTESEINSELRHEMPNQLYYPKSYQDTTSLWEDYLGQAITQDGAYTPNYYNYNDDFSLEYVFNGYIPLPSTWKYCSDCLNEFPNRIFYSEQSFQEELKDHYLNTLVNNYKDIMSSKGDITKIYNFKNTILIDVAESRFLLPSTTTAIQATEENITIGTGEFFSRPVQEVADSDVGYMGNQSQWASNLTEHGLFSIDAESGNVFLFNGKVQLLSGVDKGMNAWFQENLPLNLPKEYEDLKSGGNYPTFTNKDNPMNPFNGVGYVSTYDAKHERWILTKHDYRFTELAKTYLAGTAYPDYLRLDYDGGEFRLKNVSGLNKVVNPANNEVLFENIGWTLSFSMKRGAWISYHSYRPTNYIPNKLYFTTYNSNLVFGTIGESKKPGLWQHGDKFNYQTFYDYYFPHIIELVESKNPLLTSMYNSISFITRAKQWDSTNRYFVDKRFITFDKAIVYNDHQNSGELTLVTRDDYAELNTTFDIRQQVTPVEMRERTYSFNNFRDMIVDYDETMFTRSWDNAEYRGYYQDFPTSRGGYIDKVVNPTAINLDKNWWEQDVFRGKYLQLRLFFSILDNIKLTTHFQAFDTQPTFR